MSKYIPDRKYLSAGLAGLIAWVASKFLPSFPPDETLAAITGLMGLVAYAVPPTVTDIISRVDDTIIGLAQRSALSPASPPVAAPAAPPPPPPPTVSKK